MSLFGTLDTFALPDVLRLLAATSKSGRLEVDLTGASGPGALWLVDGAIAGVAAPGARPAVASVDVLFELLRRPQGSFSFDVEGTCPVDGPVAHVEELLAGAAELLAEWREIEAIVPSLDAALDLRDELTGEHVTVSAEQWRLLVGVGSGTTVRALGEARSLGELAVSRAVKGLVDAGLVDVGPVLATAVDVAGAIDQVSGIGAPLPLSYDVGAAVTDDDWQQEQGAGASAHRVAREDHEEAGPDHGDPHTSAPTNLLAASLHELADGATPPRPTTVTSPQQHEEEAHDEVEDDETAEVARRLSTLGPDGAAAVAAAADAATSEERDAALDAIQVEVPGEAVNRSALLKFLSTART